MSTYRVEIERGAARQINALERPEQVRVFAAIELLADDPRPPRCVAIRGYRNAYRVRVGDYRIVYEVEDAVLRVVVVRVSHRRAVYRDL